MGPLVSVLIPTRNRPELLIKAIKSVLSQTYKQIEIVITDNSYIDQSSALQHLISDIKVIYIKNANNIGPILNWRKALQLSKGMYCLILPDDDYLLNPFYIEDAVRILYDKNVSLVVPDCVLSYPAIKIIGKSGHEGFISGQDFIRTGLHIPHIGNVFRKEMALRLNAFHSNDILWSDIELWRRIMSIGGVYCYTIPSAVYLFHSSNIVLNMTRAELIINSRFIRPSVESFANEYLINNLVFSYARAIDGLGVGVDHNFIKSIMSRNNAAGSSYFMYFNLLKRRLKNNTKSFIQNAVKNKWL